MSAGTVIQIIGAVIDVEFPKENLPRIYDALEVEENGLVLEVQQQLGDGIVRTIAMGASEGLRRGVAVKNTSNPISVPVGTGTLGRIMNILGEPIDEKGEVKADKKMPIHRAPPSYEDQAETKEGGALCIGIFLSALTSPFSSIGSPRIFMILPRVPVPTGTEIGLLVFLTATPLRKPSDAPMAIVLTMPSPNCCCTSKTRPFSSTSKAS
jgi:F-type H+-transporting ATPase subunit beta